MKIIKIMVPILLLFNGIEANATQYIKIKQRALGGYTFIYVNKPRNLKKWYHDEKSDTYYRMVSFFGIPSKIKVKKHSE